MKLSVVLFVLVSAVVWVGCNNSTDPAVSPGNPAVTLPWLTDLPMAEAQAKEEHKMVFLDFTGSDWCPACIAFQKQVASTPEFASYAKTNLVLVELDFPHGKTQPEALKKANAGLVGKFKLADATGEFDLPTFLLLDDNGKQLGKWEGYAPDSGPKAFIQQLEDAQKK